MKANRIVASLLSLIIILSCRSVCAQAELPLFLQGKWEATSADSTFKSILIYKLSPFGKYIHDSNQLFNSEGKLFRIYEGVYYVEGDTLKYHVKGPGNEVHIGYAYSEENSLTHVARIISDNAISSYRSKLIRVGPDQLEYYANYSNEPRPPEEIDMTNPLVYNRIED